MKIFKTALCAALALLMAAAAIGCNVSFTTAKVEDAYTTATVDENGVPGDPVASFPADAPVVYAAAKLLNAPENTKVRIVWFYVPSNEQIAEAVITETSRSNGYIYSNLTSEQAMPEGEYRVEFYVEDREEPDASASFTVTAPGAAMSGESAGQVASAGGATVEDVHMTSYMTEAGVPVDTITVLPTTGTWYVSCILRNTQPDTMVRFVWYDAAGAVIDDYTLDPQGQTDVYVAGTLELLQTAPEGNYLVEVYLDDAAEPAGSARFEVGESTPALSLEEFTLSSGLFSIGYPADWEVIDQADDNTAWFYPAAYEVEGKDHYNAVICAMIDGYEYDALDALLADWVAATEEDNLTDYKVLFNDVQTINGRDIAVYEYTWSEDGTALYSFECFLLGGTRPFVLSFTATPDAIEPLLPVAKAMALTFTINP